MADRPGHRLVHPALPGRGPPGYPAHRGPLPLRRRGPVHGSGLLRRAAGPDRHPPRQARSVDHQGDGLDSPHPRLQPRPPDRLLLLHHRRRYRDRRGVFQRRLGNLHLGRGVRIADEGRGAGLDRGGAHPVPQLPLHRGRLDLGPADRPLHVAPEGELFLGPPRSAGRGVRIPLRGPARHPGRLPGNRPRGSAPPRRALDLLPADTGRPGRARISRQPRRRRPLRTDLEHQPPRHRESRLRPGGGGSRGAQSRRLRDLLRGAAALLQQGRAGVRYAVRSLLLAPHRPATFPVPDPGRRRGDRPPRLHDHPRGVQGHRPHFRGHDLRTAAGPDLRGRGARAGPRRIRIPPPPGRAANPLRGGAPEAGPSRGELPRRRHRHRGQPLPRRQCLRRRGRLESQLERQQVAAARPARLEAAPATTAREPPSRRTSESAAAHWKGA